MTVNQSVMILPPVWQTSNFNNQRKHREIRNLVLSNRRLTIREMDGEFNFRQFELTIQACVECPGNEL